MEPRKDADVVRASLVKALNTSRSVSPQPGAPVRDRSQQDEQDGYVLRLVQEQNAKLSSFDQRLQRADEAAGKRQTRLEEDLVGVLSTEEEKNERLRASLQQSLISLGERLDAVSTVVLQANERADATDVWVRQQVDETHANTRHRLEKADATLRTEAERLEARVTKLTTHVDSVDRRQKSDFTELKAAVDRLQLSVRGINPLRERQNALSSRQDKLSELISKTSRTLEEQVVMSAKEQSTRKTHAEAVAKQLQDLEESVQKQGTVHTKLTEDCKDRVTGCIDRYKQYDDRLQRVSERVATEASSQAVAEAELQVRVQIIRHAHTHSVGRYHSCMC